MKTFSTFLLIVILTACKTTSLVSILKSGSYESTQKVVEIDYQLKANILIVPVEIDGKSYQFMFDTGAPNVISPEVAQAIQSKSQTNKKVSDSGDKKENLDFVLIPKIKIGDAVFLETGAAVSSFNNGSVLACFNVDGIIGANLMRNCHVQIDYLAQKIRFAKDWSDLKVEEGFEIPFTHKLQGTPLVRLKVANISIDEVTVDTGYNGFINLSKSDYKLLPQEESQSSTYELIGTTTEGLFGTSGVDTTKNVWYGNYTLDTTQISLGGRLIFEGNKKYLIGNEFFSNFTTTYDWTRKIIHFTPIMKTAVMPQGYDVGLKRAGNRVEIAWVRADSKEKEMGIVPGLQVLAVNDIDTREVNEMSMCPIYDIYLEKKETIRVKVILNDTEQWITLERKDMY